MSDDFLPKHPGPLPEEPRLSTDGEFSVFQWFANDTYECVRQHVSAEEAVKAATHYCHSVGARLGTTKKVMITDGGDFCVFEWRHGEGIVFGLPGQEGPKS
jgi:hypothetical protein